MSTWYLGSAYNHPPTNAYLWQVIGVQNPECEHRDKLCADGIKRDLFQCPGGPKGYEDYVKKAIVAIPSFNLKLEIFKEDIEDVIVHYNLWKPAVRRAARVTQAFKASIGRVLPADRSRR